MKIRSEDVRSFDQLDLTIETLKDLTPTGVQADQVRGGPTSRPTRTPYYECGSM